MKLKSVLISALAAAVLLCGCSSSGKIPLPENAQINKFGSGNGYVPESRIAKQSGIYYYTDIDGKNLYRYDEADDKTYTLSTEEYAPNVYVKGDYIYRKRSKLIGKVSGLVTIKADGSGQRTILSDYDTTDFVISGDKIYFSVTDDMQNPGTYASDLSGNNTEFLCNYGSENIFVDENTLYFLKDNAVWSLDLKSKDVKKTVEYSSKGNISAFHKCGDKFVFITENNDIEVLNVKNNRSRKLNAQGFVTGSFCYKNKLWYNLSINDKRSVKIIDLDNFSVENLKDTDENTTVELFEDGAFICKTGGKLRCTRVS